MKVSIITATYNSESTILDTIKSLESQTYQNIEYIIVDGLSADSTIALIKESCTKVSTFIIEKDSGIYDALNKGLDAATGDIVGFLHSDDLFASSKSVENLVSAFEDGSDAIYADLEYVAKTDINKVVRLWKSGMYKPSYIKYGWMPPHPTFYMKTDLYKKFGGFNLSYNVAADYDSLLRYLWVNKIHLCYLPEVLIKMRVGGASNRDFKNIILKTKEDIRALQSNKVPVLLAILWKNLSKVSQFFKRN